MSDGVALRIAIKRPRSWASLASTTCIEITPVLKLTAVRPRRGEMLYSLSIDARHELGEGRRPALGGGITGVSVRRRSIAGTSVGRIKRAVLITVRLDLRVSRTSQIAR